MDKFNEHYYRKDGIPRQVIKCRDCGKLSMRLYHIDRTYISGDLHCYTCSCGTEDNTIL